MGFYYSSDGRWMTATLFDQPMCFLTPKGDRDSKAAIIIQKWYKKMKCKK